MSAARILVVDDESDIRGLLKEILSEEGYEVEGRFYKIIYIYFFLFIQIFFFR